MFVRKRLRGELIKHKFRKCHFFLLFIPYSSAKRGLSAGLSPSRARRAGAAEWRNAEPFSVVIAPPRPDLPRCVLRAQWLRTHPAQLAPESYFRLRPAVVCNHACAHVHGCLSARCRSKKAPQRKRPHTKVHRVAGYALSSEIMARCSIPSERAQDGECRSVSVF